MPPPALMSGSRATYEGLPLEHVLANIAGPDGHTVQVTVGDYLNADELAHAAEHGDTAAEARIPMWMRRPRDRETIEKRLERLIAEQCQPDLDDFSEEVRIAKAQFKRWS